MTWSLNETEALARKAARGAGLSWGLAEEAGKATRWLCSAGLPGPAALAGLLMQNDGAEYARLCPIMTDRTWQAEEGALCPLIAGAALCDRADALAAGNGVTLRNVAYPLLLIPFVAAASEVSKTTLTLRWDDVESIHQGEDVWLSAASEILAAPLAEDIHVERGVAPQGPPIQRFYRGAMEPQIADILGAFAHRTYAPDTPESRMAGAGAGTTDND
ncbi:DUF3726 domain-containing protein [Roseovarius sp. 2305UL8-3]|uniref:DUF3726 domain-containing protein n=1 Tax=Roseovarius conchicola TaxID=3121636 RepID=UPI003527E534